MSFNLLLGPLNYLNPTLCHKSTWSLCKMTFTLRIHILNIHAHLQSLSFSHTIQFLQHLTMCDEEPGPISFIDNSQLAWQLCHKLMKISQCCCCVGGFWQCHISHPHLSCVSQKYNLVFSHQFGRRVGRCDRN